MGSFPAHRLGRPARRLGGPAHRLGGPARPAYRQAGEQAGLRSGWQKRIFKITMKKTLIMTKNKTSGGKFQRNFPPLSQKIHEEFLILILKI